MFYFFMNTSQSTLFQHLSKQNNFAKKTFLHVNYHCCPTKKYRFFPEISGKNLLLDLYFSRTIVINYEDILKNEEQQRN